MQHFYDTDTRLRDLKRGKPLSTAFTVNGHEYVVEYWRREVKRKGGFFIQFVPQSLQHRSPGGQLVTISKGDLRLGVGSYYHRLLCDEFHDDSPNLVTSDTLMWVMDSSVFQYHLHRVTGPAYIDLSAPKNSRYREQFFVFGHPGEHDPLCREACHPETSPERLANMTRFKNRAVAFIAMSNPNCPTEARTEYVLLRKTDFPENNL